MSIGLSKELTERQPSQQICAAARTYVRQSIRSCACHCPCHQGRRARTDSPAHHAPCKEHCAHRNSLQRYLACAACERQVESKWVRFSCSGHTCQIFVTLVLSDEKRNAPRCIELDKDGALFDQRLQTFLVHSLNHSIAIVNFCGLVILLGCANSSSGLWFIRVHRVSVDEGRQFIPCTGTLELGEEFAALVQVHLWVTGDAMGVAKI